MTDPLTLQLEAVAEATDFSGAVRVEQNGVVLREFARGFADRASERANDVSTRFAVASGTKGLTALAVMSLIESGELELGTSVREIVGDRLPLIDTRVTIEHLLAHRGGIGDYLDEETLGDIDDHVMGAPVHILERPSDYLGLLAPHEQVFEPGTRFAYNNSGYVVLSLIIELVTGDFHAAVADRVLAPAGISDGGFFRTDEPLPTTAIGYCENGRTNIFHLPVIAAGDGGIFLTLNDMTAFWAALFAGRIVSPAAVEAMTTVRSQTDNSNDYGFGFWLGRDGSQVVLIGMDAGVSFVSAYDRATSLSYTVMSNTSSGAWSIDKTIRAFTWPVQ